MSTLQDVVDRISNDYLNRTDLNAETVRAIQTAIRQYERKRFPWNEATTTLTCVTAQPYVSVPNDFLILDALEIQYQSSSNSELVVKPFVEIQSMNAAQGYNSQPTHYAKRGHLFHLALPPDSAYPIVCHYLKRLPALTASDMSGTNDWLVEAEDLIAYHAAKLIWANTLRNNEEALKYFALEKSAQTELGMYNDQQASGRITPTSF